MHNGGHVVCKQTDSQCSIVYLNMNLCLFGQQSQCSTLHYVASSH